MNIRFLCTQLRSTSFMDLGIYFSFIILFNKIKYTQQQHGSVSKRIKK